jgi:hypothetical protein
MVKVTETEYVSKWAKRLKAATDEMRSGADKVTVAPSKLAIEAKERFKEELIKAIDEGRWDRMLAKYGLEEWKKDFKEKGVPRVSRGVDAAKDKMEEFAKWLIPRVKAGQDKVKALPKVTLDDAVARAETFIRHMAEKKYK